MRFRDPFHGILGDRSSAANPWRWKTTMMIVPIAGERESVRLAGGRADGPAERVRSAEVTALVTIVMGPAASR